MESLPDGLGEQEIRDAVAAYWRLPVTEATFAPLGFGSYHWVARTEDGRRLFLTVDDLDRKPWLGNERRAAFAGLRAAFDTALALREEAGLAFVVAPRQARDGSTVRRIAARYSLAVFPFSEGRSGHFGASASPEDRELLLRLLADLHQATKAVASLQPRTVAPLSGRDGLEAALADLGRPWQGGPFSEPARLQLAANADVVRRWLRSLDELADKVAASGRALVITHGEPHWGNLMRTADGLMLVDWDTVGLAPPERDLWLLADASAASLGAYAERTGREPDPAALAMYRLAWTLADVAAFLARFRSEHSLAEDTQHAWDAFRSCFA